MAEIVLDFPYGYMNVIYQKIIKNYQKYVIGPASYWCCMGILGVPNAGKWLGCWLGGAGPALHPPFFLLPGGVVSQLFFSLLHLGIAHKAWLGQRVKLLRITIFSIHYSKLFGIFLCFIFAGASLSLSLPDSLTSYGRPPVPSHLQHRSSISMTKKLFPHSLSSHVIRLFISSHPMSVPSHLQHAFASSPSLLTTC